MDDVCSLDCLPALLVIDGEQAWNASCSLGLISAVASALLLLFAIKPHWYTTFLGWNWKSDRQRRTGYLLLAPLILLGGLGSYDHDVGWMLIGYGLATVAAVRLTRRGRGRNGRPSS